jgi:hypothetical protein
MIGALAGAVLGSAVAVVAWRRACAVLRQQLAWSWRVAPRAALVLDVGAGNNPHLRAGDTASAFSPTTSIAAAPSRAICRWSPATPPRCRSRPAASTC